MEFLKKHYIKIIIIVLSILFLSTCCNNCSNKNEIRTLKKTYASSDSVINSLNDTIKTYKVTVKDLNNEIVSLQKENALLYKNVSDLNNALRRDVVVNITKESDNNEK